MVLLALVLDFSSNIPPYNIHDIITILEKKIVSMNHIIEDEDYELTPYYEKFEGSIQKIDSDTFEISGVFKKQGESIIIITELYPGYSTQNYKEYLMKLEETKKIISFSDNNTDEKVYFKIHMNSVPKEEEDIVHLFKLKKI